MPKLFLRTMQSQEEAVEFAAAVGGVRVDDCTIKFTADYSISKAIYSVKGNAYKVYVRIKPENAVPFTCIVYDKSSKEAYRKAREIVEKGYV